MGYAPLYFPIPTPTYDPTMLPSCGSAEDGSTADGLGAVANPDGLFSRTLKPMPPIRPVLSNVATSPATGAEATFVPVGSGQLLNLNTGQIVDGETANNIAQAAAQGNPSILTAPLSSVPPNLLSSAVQSQLQSGSLPTAQSTGITSGAGASWWTQTTNLFGWLIPNWGLLAGAGGLFLLFGGGGRKGRR